MARTSNNILRIRDLSVFYGQIRAIQRVDLQVNSGEVVALIGSNGSGKSTLLKSILGTVPINHGSVNFMGRDITGKPPEHIVSWGISIVPEGRGILPLMTVLENLQLGAYHMKGDIHKNLNEAFERFPLLEERKNQPAGNLSGGQQQMLAIARALMGSPKLLLMDEPSLGLAPIVVNQVFDILIDLKAEKKNILLSEQNARKALEYADRGYVLDLGISVAEGSAHDLIDNPDVRKAYLGNVE